MPPPFCTQQINKSAAHLEPLRAGSALVSADELAQIDAEWARWRGEWVRRKKIFNTYVHVLFIP